MLFQASFNYWIILIEKNWMTLEKLLSLSQDSEEIPPSFVHLWHRHSQLWDFTSNGNRIQQRRQQSVVSCHSWICALYARPPSRLYASRSDLLSKKDHVRICHFFKSKGAGKLRLMAPEILRSGRRQWSAIHEQGRGLLVRHHTHLYRHSKLPQVQHTKCRKWSPPSAARHDRWLSSRAACRTNQTGARPSLRSSIQEGA